MSDTPTLKVLIDRSLWGKLALLTAGGRMCCLGFVAKTLGADMDSLREIGDPAEAGEFWPEDTTPKLFDVEGDDNENSQVCQALMAVNDADLNSGLHHNKGVMDLIGVGSTTSEAEREELITKLGKLADIEFTFTGARRNAS